MTTATILGQRLANRYRILREVAEGSTGTVYLAEDAATKTKVMVKVLIPDLSFDSRTLPHLRQRLQRRLKIVPEQDSALSHIVDITDVGILSNDDLFVVMPYLQGDNLGALLRRRKILSWAQARTLVVTIGRLIAEYHREMLLEGTWPVLGTLQSSNCFCLRGRPRAESVKLVNSAVDELIIRRQWRENGSHVASLARYGAPELSTGDRLDVRADVYSLGVIVYELLTAKVPFEDSNAPRLEAMHLMSPVPLPQEVAPAAKISDGLQEVLLKALEKRPEDRFSTMTAFVDALQGIKAKKLPAVRRGSGGSGRKPHSRGDTMIMASPYFEGDDAELEDSPSVDPNALGEGADEGAGEALTAAEELAEPDDVGELDEGEGDELDEDEGVDELAAAMEASDTEVSGELIAAEPSASAEPAQPPPVRRPKVITRKLAPVASVEGTPEVVDDGEVEDDAPSSSGARPDTAPQSTRENTQVRRRPRALPEEPEEPKEPRPPLLIRRSAASAGASGPGLSPRLGGASAGRASPDAGLGELTHGDANAATARLPTIGAGLESSGATPPQPAQSEAAQSEAAKSGFGQEDVASGGSYWIWVVLALAVVGGALYASGGLGFIPGAGAGPAGAESSSTPLTSTSAEAMELVRRARAAEKAGEVEEAYKLANASYESERTVEALEIMGRCACQLDDAEMARWIYDHLPLTSRPHVQRICHRTGLNLGL